MNNITKTLLTIPPILTIGYYITFIFPMEFAWLFPTMKSYNSQMIILWIMNLFQIIYLLKKLWSFKNIDKSIKNDWTWLLIFFAVICSPIFIWKKYEKFNILNNE